MNPFSGQGPPKSPKSHEKSNQFRCCVTGCKTRSTKGFHNFPSNKKVCLEWMKKTHKLHLDVNKISKSYHKLCKKHFADCDFVINITGKIRLKKGAIPSLFLPVEVNVVC